MDILDEQMQKSYDAPVRMQALDTETSLFYKGVEYIKIRDGEYIPAKPSTFAADAFIRQVPELRNTPLVNVEDILNSEEPIQYIGGGIMSGTVFKYQDKAVKLFYSSSAKPVAQKFLERDSILGVEQEDSDRETQRKEVMDYILGKYADKFGISDPKKDVLIQAQALAIASGVVGDEEGIVVPELSGVLVDNENKILGHVSEFGRGEPKSFHFLSAEDQRRISSLQRDLEEAGCVLDYAWHGANFLVDESTDPNTITLLDLSLDKPHREAIDENYPQTS